MYEGHTRGVPNHWPKQPRGAERSRRSSCCFVCPVFVVVLCVRPSLVVLSLSLSLPVLFRGSKDHIIQGSDILVPEPNISPWTSRLAAETHMSETLRRPAFRGFLGPKVARSSRGCAPNIHNPVHL